MGIRVNIMGLGSIPNVLQEQLVALEVNKIIYLRGNLIKALRSKFALSSDLET